MSSGLTMASVQATMSEFERRFPRKTIAGKLVMRQSTADTIKGYFPVADSQSRSPYWLMPFEGVVCEIDNTVVDREVRVMNLDGEVIQVITI